MTEKSLRDRILEALYVGVPAATAALPSGVENAAAAGALAMAGHSALDFVSDLSTGTRRLRELAEAEDLRELAPEIADRAAELVDEGVADEGDAFNATATVLNAWQRARRRCASGRHSRLIAAAALHHFDPQAYREGMTLLVMETLEDLEYPDLRLLREIVKWGTAKKTDETSPFRRGMDRNSLQHLHARRLADKGLIRMPQNKVDSIHELALVVLRYVEEGFAEPEATSGQPNPAAGGSVDPDG